jgi:hypothetical protein
MGFLCYFLQNMNVNPRGLITERMAMKLSLKADKMKKPDSKYSETVFLIL